MKPDPWHPVTLIPWIIVLCAISLLLPFWACSPIASTMPTTESPGRIYWTENQNLVQEITKIHTDGNGEVIKEEVFLEYVGVLPPEKQIRLRSHDKVELVKDLSVPGAKLRK